MERFNKIGEEDVGITEYIDSSNKGFKCVLKHRYSDFIVNEIDIDGNVVWVKTKDSNIQEEEKKEELTEEKANEILKTQFVSLLNVEDKEKMSGFVSNYINKQFCIGDKIEINFLEDKQIRKKFHETLRNNFPFLDSETIEKKTKDEKGEEKSEKKLVVSYMSKNSFYKRRKVFPDKNKNVLIFAMLKKNMDTVSAMNYLCRYLHRTPKTMKFCGNKDKRGITTQKCSLFNTMPNEVIAAVKSRTWNQSIEIGNFSFSSSELRLGLLKGNQFCVALRFIEGATEEEIRKIVQSISEKGFVNYFGMQRFGVSNIPTHIIGKYVIKKQWKNAFVNILSTNTMKEALGQITIEGIDKKDITIEDIITIEDSKIQMKAINDILKIIPKYTTEYKLLYNYTRSGKNSYMSSFECLNRQLQVLYPHAYQSYIWNKTISYRLKTHGYTLIIGDIVKKHSALYQEKYQEDVDADVDEVNVEVNNDDNIFTDNFEYITKDNINKYKFDDLVMPIVGYKVHYPQNDSYEYIEKLLKEDELTFKDFEHSNVSFNATGYFRKVVEKPINEMKFEIVHHDDPDIDLLTPYYNMEPHPNVTGNKYTSARLQFQLPQSTYATMLFRELTKSSSAGNYQAGLSMMINNK